MYFLQYIKQIEGFNPLGLDPDNLELMRCWGLFGRSHLSSRDTRSASVSNGLNDWFQAYAAVAFNFPPIASLV